MEKILLKIEQQPEITLNELIDKFTLPISEAALSKRLKKPGVQKPKYPNVKKDA